MSMILTNDQYGRLMDLLEHLKLTTAYQRAELADMIKELDQVKPFYIEPAMTVEDITFKDRLLTPQTLAMRVLNFFTFWKRK